MQRISFASVVLLLLLGVTMYATTTNVQAYAIPNCGAFGIDLSPISYDILYNTSSYVYVIHPCGVITDTGCLADPTANLSMVCQRGTTNSYSLSNWNSSTVIYSRDVGGIYQQLLTGEMCGANPRQTFTYYQCDPTATTPQFVSVVETSTCVYALTVKTNLTCALTHPQPCVFDGVDLNPMFAQGDLNFTNSFNWYVHMCASSTSNSLCHNDSTSNTSMVCQQRLDGSDSFGIAIYNESLIQWQVVPTGLDAGLVLTVPNGEYCAAVSRNRIARIQMICDISLNPEDSYITGVVEASTCTYQITIITSLTCSVVETTSSTGPGLSLSSSWYPPTNNACVFNGYNLAPLIFTPDLYWGGYINNNYYDFYFHMCGIVRNRQCLSDPSTYNSMFCQTSVTNPNENFALDYFVPNDLNFTTTQYGLQYVSYLGELCGSLRRTTTVNFICDLGVTRITSLTQNPINLCDINLEIKSPLVCNPGNTNLPPQPPECVYNGWDFKPLTAEHDLQMITNGSTIYTISLQMCAPVMFEPCKRDSSSWMSMVCQTRTDLQSYSLGDYVPNSQNWSENATAQSITMVVGHGELCGANPRVSHVEFKCDLAYQALTGNSTAMILFEETTTCVYHIVVIYNDLVCAYFNGSRWNTTESSSTGSSNVGSSTGGVDICAADNIPAGSVLFSIVLNRPAYEVPSYLDNGFYQAFSEALLNAAQLDVSPDHFACGNVAAGTNPLPSVANATASQSIFSFLILPTGGLDTSAVANQLQDIVQNSPALLNSVLPVGYPAIIPGEYDNVQCSGDDYPTTNGCVKKPDSSDSGSDLSDGDIAGIVVGSVVGGLLLIALVIFLIMRTRKGSATEGKNVEMGTRA